MIERQPIHLQPNVLRWLLVAAGTALACGLGLWFLEVCGRKISPMWPAAGVGLAFFVHYGWKVAPAVMAGHLATWFYLVPGSQTWPILLVPVTFAFEAWLLSFAAYRDSGRGMALRPVAWRHVVAPFLCTVPCALVTAATFTFSGRFHADSFGTSVFLIMTAHVHGIMACGNLTVHLLRKDFNFKDIMKSLNGVLAAVAALALMSLAFVGIFDSFLSQSSAIFLPFPLLVMAAVWLSPAPVSLLVALWCVLSTALTCAGEGPFVSGPGALNPAMNPAELGLYNMVMASVAYLVSIGSSHLMRQLNLNEIALAAAGIELWEWETGHGFSRVQGNPATGYLRETTAGLEDQQALGALAGTAPGSTVISDSWRSRVHGGKSGPVLESVGRVLQRGLDLKPTKAIGLLQDLSDTQKTEEALMALGQQKAKLRSLQAQLNPHFLFNSLNVIRALVHISPVTADEAITSLAELLRSSLRNTGTTLITLREETDHIRALFHLARLRFGNRLQTRIEIPPELLEIPVPPMLLLNLVENAMTHGIGSLEKGGTITLAARCNGGSVRISVLNTGTLPPDAVRGLGTSDALQRLELLYSAGAKFSLAQADPRTVAAELTLPLPLPHFP